jgi:hypothetical protein
VQQQRGVQYLSGLWVEVVPGRRVPTDGLEDAVGLIGALQIVQAAGAVAEEDLVESDRVAVIAHGDVAVIAHGDIAVDQEHVIQAARYLCCWCCG